MSFSETLVQPDGQGHVARVIPINLPFLVLMLGLLAGCGKEQGGGFNIESDQPLCRQGVGERTRLELQDVLRDGVEVDDLSDYDELELEMALDLMACRVTLELILANRTVSTEFYDVAEDTQCQ